MASLPRNVLLRHLRRLVGAASTDLLTDRALLQRFAAEGDEAAFATLVQRHGPMVLRVCRYILGNVHDAEDAFQATFLVLARRAATLTWQESVAGWLHAVASRIAFKARTAARRRRAHEARAVGTPQSGGGDDITLREAQEVLNEKLNRLPEKLRLALVLCYLEGMTQDQAARQTGWSLSTLKRRLRDGLERLQGRLQRRGVALAAVLSVTLLNDAAFTSAAQVEAVTRAGVLFRPGLSAGAKASPAAVLAERLLRATFLTRLGFVGAVLLAAALAVIGGLGVWKARTASPRPTERMTRATPTLAALPLRRDHAGDPLPPHAEDRLGAGPLRLKGRPLGVAFSPDGTRLASCGGLPDGTLRLWKAATGRELWRRRLGCGARAVAFAPDGPLLAVACDDGTVRLCDPDTGKELRRLHGHAKPVTALVFTPDRKSVISASLDGTVRRWDRNSGKETRRFSDPGRALCSLALSRDGTLLAVGSEDLPTPLHCRVLLWELPSGKARPSLAYYPGGVQALAFAPDGRTLAVGGQAGIINLWDMTGAGHAPEEINPPLAWKALPFGVAALAFPAGGRVLTVGCYDGAVYVCDRTSHQLRQRLTGLGAPADKVIPWGILSLALASDGKTLAAGGSDWVIHVWEMPSGKERSFERRSSR